MLSITPDINPDAHSTSIDVAAWLPCVTLIIHSAISLIPPVASSPPIIINRPTKKKIVFHSTSLKISDGFSNTNKNAAPNIAATHVEI